MIRRTTNAKIKSSEYPVKTLGVSAAARGIDDEEDAEEEEEEEEVLTLPALLFARDLNSASVVNADACDARDRDEGAPGVVLS